ncbi:hypothetical protein AVEN_120731-1, partial [Araneus ventricosus]
ARVTGTPFNIVSGPHEHAEVTENDVAWTRLVSEGILEEIHTVNPALEVNKSIGVQGGGDLFPTACSSIFNNVHLWGFRRSHITPTAHVPYHHRGSTSLNNPLLTNRVYGLIMLFPYSYTCIRPTQLETRLVRPAEKPSTTSNLQTDPHWAATIRKGRNNEQIQMPSHILPCGPFTLTTAIRKGRGKVSGETDTVRKAVEMKGSYKHPLLFYPDPSPSSSLLKMIPKRKPWNVRRRGKRRCMVT